jgi:hypothetical protein
MFVLLRGRPPFWHGACSYVSERGVEPRGNRIQEYPALKRTEGTTTMPVQTKSLISTRPAEKKDTTKPVETGAIGQSKTLTANALQRRSFKKSLKRAGGALSVHTMKQKK